MMMILFSCSGIPGCGVMSTLLGVFGDAYGLRTSFLLIPLSFFIVFVLMAWDWRRERMERMQ